MDKPATLEAVASLSPSHNAAMGALVGAACGDAAGAVLEFMHPPPTEDDVEQALAFPGGGCWNVGPGQITDDVELVLAQADGLLAGRGALNTTRLAAAYHAWYSSSPFDVGMATRGAFGKPGSGEETAKRSVDLNAKSQANGALMRATPLGVWAHRLTPAEAFAAGVADAKLSHPNASACGCNGAYVAALAHLVARPGDSAGARAAAETVLSASPEYTEAAGWLCDSDTGGPDVPYSPFIGWVRIAFTHAFRHLRLRTPLEAALRETLRGGGDTDTNAAIVCGLLGALHGAGGIEPRLWRPVLGCEAAMDPGPQYRGLRRPAWLSASRLPVLAAALVDAAPTRLVIK